MLRFTSLFVLLSSPSSCSYSSRFVWRSKLCNKKKSERGIICCEQIGSRFDAVFHQEAVRNNKSRGRSCLLAKFWA